MTWTLNRLLGVFKRFLLDLRSGQRFTSIEKLFRYLKDDIVRVLTTLIDHYRGVKVHFVLEVRMRNNTTEDEVDNYISSKSYSFLHETGINNNLYLILHDLISNINLFVQNGSNWSVMRINEININLAKYKAFKTGFGLPTPTFFKNRKGLYNIPAPGNKCFMYCIICKYTNINNKRAAQALFRYKEFEELNKVHKIINFSGLDSPDGVSLEQINRFERLNPGFSVNVYHYDGKKDIYPVRLTKEQKKEHTDLLRIFNDSGDSHFLLMNDFSAFFGGMNYRKKYYCRSCLHGFYDKAKRDEHSKICGDYISHKIVFPEKDYFTKSIARHRWSHPNWIAADFETVIVRTHDEAESNSRVDGIHVPISCAFVEVAGDGAKSYRTFVGEDCDVRLIECLLEKADSYLKDLREYKDTMTMTKADWHDFITAKKCCICSKEFLNQSNAEDSPANLEDGETTLSKNEVNMRKVRHHDHFKHNDYRYVFHFKLKPFL